MKEEMNNTLQFYHNKNTHSNEYTTSATASLKASSATWYTTLHTPLHTTNRWQQHNTNVKHNHINWRRIIIPSKDHHNETIKEHRE